LNVWPITDGPVLATASEPIQSHLSVLTQHPATLTIGKRLFSVFVSFILSYMPHRQNRVNK